MQLNDALIKSVVQEVLAAMNQKVAASSAPASNQYGVFRTVDEAVEAAARAQAEFEKRPIEDRTKALDCIRKICRDQAEELGRMEFEETKIGRLEHKYEKLRVVADRIPGTEFLKTDTFSGSMGVALIEYASVRRHRGSHPRHPLAAHARLQRHQHARFGQQRCHQSSP